MADDTVLPTRKPSTSVDELEDVAASPASSVMSADQLPAVNTSSRTGRRGMPLLTHSCLAVSGCVFQPGNKLLIFAHLFL